MKFGLNIPTRLVFGAGELKNLHSIPLPGHRALVVVSSGTAMKTHGYLDTLLDQLRQSGIEAEVFDRALSNPIKGHVMDGAAVCQQCGCDFVIGLGGGSSIDTAKAIAITVGMGGGDFWKYVRGGTGGGQPVTKALPIVAIPSTAGTGTEVDPWGVITNEDTNEKIGFGTPLIFPHTAIVDPELMLTVPPILTAYQGFDAFFHAAEGYISQAHTPISDLYALEAIRLLYKYLPVAVADGNNMWARIKVAWASTLAGMVESTSCCTGEHALEHAMSAYFPKLPHGAGLIAISAAYFKTFKNDSMKRYMKMAEKMRQVKSARPSDFLDALEVMKRSCNVDNIRLSDWGITMADFERFADNAIATGSAMLDLDPRFLNKEQLINIYMESYK